MNKQEFISYLRPSNCPVNIDHRSGEFFIWPRYRLISPEIKPVRVRGITDTLYTKTNADNIREKLEGECAVFVDTWRNIQTAYRKTADYRNRKIQLDILNLAHRAGLEYDEHGTVVRSNGWGTDRFDLTVLDYVHKKKDLKHYHACGKYLALVEQTRARTYAASSQYRLSESRWVFIVGTNENGVPFCHQVPKHFGSLADAIEWIWNGHKIEQRQGDVAITRSHLKHARGEVRNERLIDSHFIFAEIYDSQGTHIRNGFIYHEKDQHPPIYVGSEWKKVIVALRSTEGMSSAD